ncbi:thiamine biosynthesis lipoprotein [Nakamurella panacisegetis]|uniref:FAD:protein FMN transferase n=1 Tax=Nakamurella panacisegetis TaxID=1090615 RepID=A0A1H0SAJ7_9ACTN|nr:FAD:protein FMN transferase [Nakamurella panacisegetis]SDP38783.1 thiamine biosynthesis lipoprotein [Nakamurella panacisegetis]
MEAIRTSPADRQATRVDFEIWSTTATLVVTDARDLDRARAELDAELAAMDLACSRFRPDSEINRLLRTPGVEVELSPVLNDALTAALRLARATDHLVDPTVAAAVIALGYDRDIRQVRDRELPFVTCGPLAAPGAWLVDHDREAHTVTVPVGVGLDLGATAKPLAADRAAARIAAVTGGGVLVGLGGDIAVAGEPAEPGWTIAVGDDHRTSETRPDVTVTIRDGGLATSSVMGRRWPTSRGERHHLIDPRTGDNPDSPWRTVSVTARSAAEANAAATAAIILGDRAPAWLAELGLPARLVALDGETRRIAGWPAGPAVAA